MIELSGNASPGVFAIKVEGHPEVTLNEKGVMAGRFEASTKEGDNG